MAFSVFDRKKLWSVTSDVSCSLTNQRRINQVPHILKSLYLKESSRTALLSGPYQVTSTYIFAIRFKTASRFYTVFQKGNLEGFNCCTSGLYKLWNPVIPDLENMENMEILEKIENINQTTWITTYKHINPYIAIVAFFLSVQCNFN